MSKVQTVSVVAFLSFCLIVGALVFSRGFLLNRQIIHETSESESCSGASDRNGTQRQSLQKQDGLSSMSSWCNPKPPFPKVILILVDALRHDFVQRMEFLSAITTKDVPKTHASCTFKFIADPPTTTMQRLKALMTGTMPTFIDASANFNSYEIEEDSLIYQLDAIGKKIAFLGDDTWLSLFPKKYFRSKYVEAHPSFNAWDLDTVDRAVNKTIRDIFSHPNEGDWDVLITHLLGVDHCGHRYGPNHPEMVRKLHEADSIVKYVFNSMSRDTLLVIFGDHGMTSTGDHGGDSKDEVEAAVIFLSKKHEDFNPTFKCPKQLSISQIDLVPTLSPLLGIPIPYSNIGQIIPNFLQNETYYDAIAANVAQVHKYIQHFSTMLLASETSDSNAKSRKSGSLTEQYENIKDAFKEYQSVQNSVNRDNLRELSELYLSRVKSVATSTWTQFNLPMIYTGVLISFLSVLSLTIYLLCTPSLSRSLESNNYSVLSWLWPSLSHWSVLCTFVYHSVTSSGLIGIVVSTLSGLLVFLALLVFKVFQIRRQRNESNILLKSISKILQNVSGVVSVVVYLITCLAVFSNSFVINEGYVIGYSLVFIALIEVVSAKWVLQKIGGHSDNLVETPDSCQGEDPLHLPVVQKFFRCSWSCFVGLVVIVRISVTFFRCREEQVDCSEEFLLHKQLSSLPEDWLVHKYFRYGIALLALAVFVVSFRHWMIYRSCIFSRKPRAIITRFIPSLLVVLLGVFWALQGLPYISTNASKIRLLMNYLPLVYQAVTIASLICVWLKPICCIGHLRPLFYKNYTKVDAHGGHQYAYNRNSIREPAQSTYKNVKMRDATQFNKMRQSNGVNGRLSHDHNKGRNESPYIQSKYNSRIISCDSLSGTRKLCECFSEDTYSSCFLTFGSLVTLLLVQVSSTGIAPAIILEAYALVCLVGIYRKPTSKGVDSWSTAVAWTLTSQYFFYATGHQPIFSAIPWDSAFVGGADGSGLATTSVSWLSWGRAAMAVVGNLHVSQIISSFSLPLLVYWTSDKSRLESTMGATERQKAYLLYGKFLALHGFKLMTCMCCAGWHRRHLMVWKIFAPKFIFEAVSFVVTSSVSVLGIVFLSRINYFHQKIAQEDTHPV